MKLESCYHLAKMINQEGVHRNEEMESHQKKNNNNNTHISQSPLTSNRSYNFDELREMFEKIGNKNYQDNATDESLTKSSVSLEKLETFPANSTKINDDIESEIQPKIDLMEQYTIHEKTAKYAIKKAIKKYYDQILRRNKEIIQSNTSHAVNTNNTFQSNDSNGTNSNPNKLRKSFKRLFPIFDAKQAHIKNTTFFTPPKFTPREERKVIIRQKLQLCLHRLIPNIHNILLENKQSNPSVENIFIDGNEKIYNVGGITFVVYQQNHSLDTINKKVIVTLHDIAHNPKTNFEMLFSNNHLINSIENDTVVYHICLPGQSPNDFSPIRDYPGISELSRMLTVLMASNLKIKSCIGIGVGAGADLLLRCSLLAPMLYSHLVLVNIKLRTIDKFKLLKYPLIFNPINSHLTQYGAEYLESNCIRSFCASTVNIEPLNRYKKFLKQIKTNPNLSQLIQRFWKRPDLNYYTDENFRRLESIPKILIKPRVLMIEGLINPSKNTRGDILDFTYPGVRIYHSFENGSKLVLDEYTDQIARLITTFINNELY